MAEATDPKGVTGALATWLAKLTLDDVPEAVRETGRKYLLLDGIGCALVGAKLPWSVLATETVMRFEVQGDKTIIGWGETAAGPCGGVAQQQLHPGLRTGRLPSHRAAAQRFAAIACADRQRGRRGRCWRKCFSTRRDQGLRNRSACWSRFARRTDAVARLAFGAGIRHPRRCRRRRFAARPRRGGL